MKNIEIAIYSELTFFMNVLHVVLTKCGQKTNNKLKIKRNFKNKNFQFSHMHCAAQWLQRSSQFILCCCQWCLNPGVIC
jgi:hypothetical protein